MKVDDALCIAARLTLQIGLWRADQGEVEGDHHHHRAEGGKRQEQELVLLFHTSIRTLLDARRS